MDARTLECHYQLSKKGGRSKYHKITRLVTVSYSNRRGKCRFPSYLVSYSSMFVWLTSLNVITGLRTEKFRQTKSESTKSLIGVHRNKKGSIIYLNGTGAGTVIGLLFITSSSTVLRWCQYWVDVWGDARRVGGRRYWDKVFINYKIDTKEFGFQLGISFISIFTSHKRDGLLCPLNVDRRDSVLICKYVK